MNKKAKILLFIVTPAILLAATGITIGVVLSSKENSKTKLTYATLIEDKAQELDYGTLTTKMGYGENMVVATYLGQTHCSCWANFNNIIDEYAREFDASIYFIDRWKIYGKSNDFNMTLQMDSSDPSFVIFENGKIKKEFTYSANKNIFTKYDSFVEMMNTYTEKPQYIRVNQEILDEALFTNKESVIIEYEWNYCPDCQDVYPNVIKPYIEKNTLSKPIWVIDIGDLPMATGEFDKTNPIYTAFLDEHQMSEAGNATYGYGRGFVPTFQYWENGVLKDASVYFNDTINEEGGNYTITNSFYSQERVNNLKYTDTVLLGKQIPANEIEDGSWKIENARKVHGPLLEAFLNYYANKD